MPPDKIIDWARRRHRCLRHLLDDNHRLGGQPARLAELFDDFLRRLAPDCD